MQMASKAFPEFHSIPAGIARGKLAARLEPNIVDVDPDDPARTSQGHGYGLKSWATAVVQDTQSLDAMDDIEHGLLRKIERIVHGVSCCYPRIVGLIRIPAE
jgi:hypothetical protein